MKKFAVPLTRTTIETAVVTVEAPDKRTAGFMAAQATQLTWEPQSAVTKVGVIEQGE